MAYIRLPLGIRVSVEYLVFGKIVVNVYHVTTTEPIITAQLNIIAAVFETWFNDHMAATLSLDIEMIKITLLNLDEENGEKLEYAVTPAIPGERTGAAMPNNVALVASYATAKTGRSFLGRSYIAGLQEIDVTENSVTLVYAAGLTVVQLLLITALLLENSSLVVASFEHLGVPRAVGVATPITAISVNTRVDTQRRRLPRV